MPRTPSLAFLLALALYACTPASGPSGGAESAADSGIERAVVFRVGRTNYAVSRRHGVRGGIRVRTRDNVDGTRRGAFTAARWAFGCQSLTLNETVPVWRVAEGRGQFCDFDRHGGVGR